MDGGVQVSESLFENMLGAFAELDPDCPKKEEKDPAEKFPSWFPAVSSDPEERKPKRGRPMILHRNVLTEADLENPDLTRVWKVYFQQFSENWGRGSLYAARQIDLWSYEGSYASAGDARKTIGYLAERKGNERYMIVEYVMGRLEGVDRYGRDPEAVAEANAAHRKNRPLPMPVFFDREVWEAREMYDTGKRRSGRVLIKVVL